MPIAHALAASGPDDTVIFGIILVGFPLFGAAVFFWWRWQYGVWAPKSRARKGQGGEESGARVITISDPKSPGSGPENP